MLKYRRITLFSSAGSGKTDVYLWRPDCEVRGVVQIVHGMREHMGRYDHFAAFLMSQGYAVIGHDHMGHGQSGSGDSVFGFFGERDGPKILLRDCRRVAHIIRREYPGVPIFMLGHSMGSFIGRLYILRYSKELAGFICMGTGGEKLLAPVGRALAEAAVRFHGYKKEGWFFDSLTFSPYRKNFADEHARMAWLSRDAAEVEKYENDELIRPCFTNAGFRDLYELQIAASGKKWAALVDKYLPVLLVSGSDDPVGDYGKGVVQVYERLKMAGVLDVECKLYEGARHEILNEINREEVYYDIFSWMEDHIVD